jgi:hypothetical protein
MEETKSTKQSIAHKNHIISNHLQPLHPIPYFNVQNISVWGEIASDCVDENLIETLLYLYNHTTCITFDELLDNLKTATEYFESIASTISFRDCNFDNIMSNLNKTSSSSLSTSLALDKESKWTTVLHCSHDRPKSCSWINEIALELSPNITNVMKETIYIGDNPCTSHLFHSSRMVFWEDALYTGKQIASMVCSTINRSRQSPAIPQQIIVSAYCSIRAIIEIIHSFIQNICKIPIGYWSELQFVQQWKTQMYSWIWSHKDFLYFVGQKVFNHAMVLMDELCLLELEYGHTTTHSRFTQQEIQKQIQNVQDKNLASYAKDYILFCFGSLLYSVRDRIEMDAQLPTDQDKFEVENLFYKYLSDPLRFPVFFHHKMPDDMSSYPFAYLGAIPGTSKGNAMVVPMIGGYETECENEVSKLDQQLSQSQCLHIPTGSGLEYGGTMGRTLDFIIPPYKQQQR